MSQGILQSCHSNIWQDAAIHWLGGANKPTIQHIGLDDVLELEKALEFNRKSQQLVQLYENNKVTFNQVSPLLVQIYN